MSDSRLVRALQNRERSQPRRMVPVVDESGKPSTVEGFFLVNGAGEAAMGINFPVKFTERPNVQCSGELIPGQVLEVGAFPTLSVLVGQFRVVEHNESSEGTPFLYWVGASIIVVTTGTGALKLRIHWRASGMALVPGADDVVVNQTGTLEEPSG